jgi:hypothetical protein
MKRAGRTMRPARFQFVNKTHASYAPTAFFNLSAMSVFSHAKVS